MNVFLEKSLNSYLNACLYGSLDQIITQRKAIEAIIDEIGKEMILYGEETLDASEMSGHSVRRMIEKIDATHLYLAPIYATNGYDFNAVDQFFLFMERAEFWLNACNYAQFGRLDRSMMSAAQKGNKEAIQFFLNLGVPVDAGDGMALKLAVKSGDLETITMLLDGGADIHLDDEAAIYMANLYRHYDVVRFLHSKGGALVAREGQLLEDAVKNRDLVQIDYLIENGLDPKVYGQKAVQVANVICNIPELFEKVGRPIMSKLLDHGANPEWVDRKVLMSLLAKGKPFVKLLHMRSETGKGFGF